MLPRNKRLQWDIRAFYGNFSQIEPGSREGKNGNVRNSQPVEEHQQGARGAAATATGKQRSGEDYQNWARNMRINEI